MTANRPLPGSAFSLAERLAELPYFSSLSPERLEALAGHAICRQFATGEMLIVQGEPSSGLWIIETGHVKVFRLNADGREYIMRLPGPGESFNDIPALDNGPNAASVVALSDTTAWSLPAPVLEAELRTNPHLAMDVIHLLTHRVRVLVQQVEDLALCSVTARLARFLLERMDTDSLNHPAITRATIAAFLATTPETVSRGLRTLEKIGAIRFDRHEIIIERDDLLRSVAFE